MSVGEPAQWVDLPSHTRQILSSLRDGELLTPNTTKAGTAGIALQHPEGVLVVWIDLAEQRPFTLEDQTLLTVLAGRLGQGLQRVYQVDQQRETALALQHAILGPAQLPGGFEVRYQAASRPLQVGGDWYDVMDLDDGRIALVVGDCVGHDLAAATVMGQVRSACRALLLGDPSPSAALAGMDRFAARLPGARCTTAVSTEMIKSSSIMANVDHWPRRKVLRGQVPPCRVMRTMASKMRPMTATGASQPIISRPARSPLSTTT